MVESEGRWGSSRARQAVVTGVMVGLLVLALALAFALGRARKPRFGPEVGHAAPAEPAFAAKSKLQGSPADRELVSTS